MADPFTSTSGTLTSSAAPGGSRRSRALGLVPFLFAVAGTEQLGGLVLVRLLGDLGMGTAAARGQLARMRRDEQLGTSRRGRGVDYRLIGPFAATFRRLGALAATAPRWEGHFHALLHHVPEEHRAYRDRLRRTAQLLGYGVMQQGVLIAVGEHRADLAAVLAQAPPGCRVYHATVGLPAADAAEAARSAWDLDDIADRLRGHVRTLAAAAGTVEAPADTAASMRTLARLRNAPLVDLISDPGLPAELLPPDWPVPELVRLIEQMSDRYVPPARRYVHSVIAATASDG